MKKIFLVLVFCLLNNSVFAALPPLYHTVREYKAIFESQELYDLLNSAEVIQGVHKLPQGGYLVFTQDQVIIVEVVYQPSKMPGPGSFDLKFRSLVEKK